VLSKIFNATGRTVVRIFALLAAYGLYALHALTPAAIWDAVLAVWPYALIFAGIGIVYDLTLKSRRSPWRFKSIQDILVIIRRSTVTVLVLLITVFVFDRAKALPRSTLFLTWVFDIAALAGAVLVTRAIHERAFAPVFAPFLSKYARQDQRALLLMGDLEGADAFLRSVSREDGATQNPIGIVTRDASDVGREIRGVKVVASLAASAGTFERLIGQQGDRAVLFVGDSIAPADLDGELLGRLRSAEVLLLRRSRTIELYDNATKPRLREFNFEELLSRAPVELGVSEIRNLISGKRVLVTGAGGSIGSEVCRQVAALGCAHLGLLDHSEFALFNIDMEISDSFPTLSRKDILCDVRNAERVKSWVEDQKPDIIFHAAALKHVPLMERHPCEGILTNVVGTWNVADAARMSGVGQMVFISTDKAVDPGNVMGATKRLAESVMRTHRSAASTTRFSVVRFGNVLGSAGSVVPTFKAQIERGGPVTVTHPDVERYFMTIPEAVQLVLHATATSAGRSSDRSGVFVLDMGKPVKIMDLARRLIELSDKPADRVIEIQITGLRPGEKLTEELVDSTEEAHLRESGVFEITDRVQGERIDRSTVKQLEAVAFAGVDEPARRLIFDLLKRVRTGQAYTAKLGA
jgi:O-antigen biosynthesis protein WbqV